MIHNSNYLARCQEYLQLRTDLTHNSIILAWPKGRRGRAADALSSQGYLPARRVPGLQISPRAIHARGFFWCDAKNIRNCARR